MLTDESYLIAWAVYLVGTLGALLILNAWTAKRVAVGWRSTVLLVLAALALAPSHPVEDASSWAPAIFVASFDLLTDGLEVAMRSLRSLAMGVVMALALALILQIGRLILGRRPTPE